VDYRVRRETSQLNSTGYVEIGPGKYSGKHWQDGFLFVWEDAFGMAEGIVAKHVSSYDHFSTTDIPKDVGQRVIAEWRDAADRLSAMSPAQAHAALNLQAAYRERLDAEVDLHRDDIANMLRDLADECSKFYEREEWICVLGI
jgi:hypothetical protein